MQAPSASRKYSDEEKRQLLANLDLEGQFLSREGPENQLRDPPSCPQMPPARGSAPGPLGEL